jgi:hypothetical protein
MAAAAFALFTGCTGQNVSSPSAVTPSVSSSLNVRAATKQQSGGPTVYAESRNAAGLPFVAVFSDGGASFARKIKHGAALAADSSGYVYIAHSPVTVYSDAGKTLVQKFPVMNGPSKNLIVTDGLGDFYVLCGHKPYKTTLCEYAIGKTGPVRQLNAAGFDLSIATDASGNLYFGTGYNSVVVYAPGGTSPQRTITNGVAGPESIAVDPQGNLYVGNANSTTNHIGTISVYAPGGSSPSRTISNGVTSPIAIHADSIGNLGVLNGYNGFISTPANMTMYASGSGTPLSVITDGLDAPTSFAFDSSDNLYVSNIGATNNDPGSITVYAAGSYSLTRTITKNIEHSVSVAVGP